MPAVPFAAGWRWSWVVALQVGGGATILPWRAASWAKRARGSPRRIRGRGCGGLWEQHHLGVNAEQAGEDHGGEHVVAGRATHYQWRVVALVRIGQHVFELPHLVAAIEARGEIVSFHPQQSVVGRHRCHRCGEPVSEVLMGNPTIDRQLGEHGPFRRGRRQPVPILENSPVERVSKARRARAAANHLAAACGRRRACRSPVTSAPTSRATSEASGIQSPKRT